MLFTTTVVPSCPSLVDSILTLFAKIGLSNILSTRCLVISASQPSQMALLLRLLSLSHNRALKCLHKDLEGQVHTLRVLFEGTDSALFHFAKSVPSTAPGTL